MSKIARVTVAGSTAVLLATALTWFLVQPRPGLPAGRLLRASFALHYPRMGRNPDEPGRMVDVLRSSADPKVMNRLLEVVNGARGTEAHKCAPQGELTFEYASGSPRTVLFYRGNDAKYYEFATRRQSYRVARAKVLDVADMMGIPTDDMPR